MRSPNQNVTEEYQNQLTELAETIVTPERFSPDIGAVALFLVRGTPDNVVYVDFANKQIV